MWEVLWYLEWKQGPYDFDYGFSLTSFQLHRIDPGDTQTKNTRNGTQNMHLPNTKNTQIYLFAMYLGKIPQPTSR